MVDQNSVADTIEDGSILIIGAGPAGLTAGYTLLDENIPTVILEKDEVVGGISRTFEYRGYRFDVGGHRFFTNIPEIQALWEEILGKELKEVRRRSRIYYQNKLFHYPLSLKNILLTLGVRESLLILLSFIKAKLVPLPEEKNFEQWTINRFGKHLYLTFFKSYTEKVWGIPCHEIQSDWAKQRIKGLSVFTVVLHALFGFRKLKTLTGHFFFPDKGAGMMWHKMQSTNEARGCRVFCNAKVVSIHHANGRIVSLGYRDNYRKERDTTRQVNVSHLISTMPVSLLIDSMDPVAPAHVRAAANELKFRSFIQVCLIISNNNLFPDQWLYIHDPDIRAGRIQNFRNWSRAMVPDQQSTGIGMEYFCSQDDDLWLMKDEKLIDLATEELAQLQLADRAGVVDGFVIRQPYAYPVYDAGYDEQLSIIRNYLDGFSNLQTIGRNGMHRYNNMDHSMRAGILAAQNIMGDKHDVWDFEETSPDVTARKVLASEQSRKKLAQSFARMDKRAFAVAIGITCGLFFSLMTSALIIKGGAPVGANLALLSQYCYGYTVSWQGAALALVYGFLWGGFFGYIFAFLRNSLVILFVHRARKNLEGITLKSFFDQS